MTVEEILQLEAWIEKGEDEEERERRVERVREKIFPSGLSADEVEARIALVEQAKERRSEEEIPTPGPAPAPEPTAPPIGRERRPSRAREHLRRHDRSVSRVEEMTRRARGSPFFDDDAE